MEVLLKIFPVTVCHYQTVRDNNTLSIVYLLSDFYILIKSHNSWSMTRNSKLACKKKLTKLIRL